MFIADLGHFLRFSGLNPDFSLLLAMLLVYPPISRAGPEIPDARVIEINRILSIRFNLGGLVPPRVPKAC